MIQLGQKSIVAGGMPFIVAELSGNHNGDIKRAKAIIDAAANAGADAVKLQTYTADTMTLDSEQSEFHVTDPDNPWSGYSLHQLYDEAHTPWDWHQELFEYIEQKGMVPFSSPFDETSVDFLESLECPLYKIASFELTDIPLLQKIASTGKPIIMSTGMASLGEIEESLQTIRSVSQAPVVLLKCTSTYPATPENSNLNTMSNLRDWSGALVGLSDHTMGSAVAVAATAMGAVVIEKHMTLSRADGGVDAAFSLEPAEFSAMVHDVRQAYVALGHVRYGGSQDEQKSKQYRRSVYFKKAVQKGQIITKDDLCIVRPANGLAPKYFDHIVGCKAVNDISRGEATAWHHLEILT